ncbi:hypothetical protein [Bacillus sp. EE-W1]|uniref:hypothetical protein n=1 Tax=Bacillus sp. EE-W1 TaxID=2662453 RepID=UPI0012F797CB|nr:hypothetical protein [Bacillus sp. EE-W1]
MWFFYKGSFQNEHLDYCIENIEGFFVNTFAGLSFLEAIDTEFFQKLNRTNLVKKYLKGFHENYNKLSLDDKFLIKGSFRINTDIELICVSKLKPVKYSELPGLIRKDLENIFNYLYDDFPKVKYFKESVGSLKEYYHQFYEHNFSQNTLCPFCGLKFMKTSGDKRREPFDHYLLRSQYPFVSLIRNNLVPMCHDCNEDYKKEYDISNVKVFYPFTEAESDVELKVNGNEIEIHSDRFNEEVEAWNNIFDVKQRVKNYVQIHKSAILSNLTEFEWIAGEKELLECLERKVEAYNSYLYCRDNYIEKAILLDEFSDIIHEEIKVISTVLPNASSHQSNNEHSIKEKRELIRK